MDGVLLYTRGAQALPQICPIMVVAKVDLISKDMATNGHPPMVRLKVVDSIWGHLKKNTKVKALWLPLENISEIDDNFDTWSKLPLKTPSVISQKEVVLGLFPSENKKEYEFMIKPLCRYLATEETIQRLNCLREKRCREFLPGRLVIR
jgi:hypothetical protein